MDLAQWLGLRVHAPLRLENGRVLLIERFDRRVDASGPARSVVRLAQESIASFTGHNGFDSVPSHDAVCSSAIDPQGRLQRDALAQGLAVMAPKLAQIAQQGTALGLETEVHLHLQRGLNDMAERLQALV